MEIIKSDITVVGGGIAGMCTALAAARHGLKVALVNDRPVLGGVASSELGVNVCGAAGGSRGSSASVYAREGGIIEEIKLTIERYGNTNERYGSSNPMRDAALLDIVLKEENIELCLNTLVTDIEKKGSNITAVLATQMGSERRLRFESPLFADSTGDGIVGYLAGAEFMMGREGREQFHESYAPEQADGLTMGHTLVFHSKDVGQRVKYIRPAFAYDIKKMPFFHNLHKQEKHRTFWRKQNEFHTIWWIEFGGQLNTVTDNEKITLELKKLVYGMWDYIKNSGEFENVDNLELTYVSPIAGKRESRRFAGDYVLTQNDLRNKKEFGDAVAVGGWPMDVHAPKGIYDDEPASSFYYVPGMYSIPFRCMYSKDIGNLFLAGRDISTTHIAFGSTRVMGTGGCVGQAVGTAGYLCKKYNISPRLLASSQQYVEELQEVLLADDQTILGRKQQMNQELLQNMAITASSVKEYCNDGFESIVHLDKNYILGLPLKTDWIDSAEIRIKNNTDAYHTLTLGVWGGKGKENYAPSSKIKDIAIAIPPKWDDWITVPIACNRSEDGKIYLAFDKNNYLSVYYTRSKLTGAVTFQHLPDAKYFIDIPHIHPFRTDENICFRNVMPSQAVYSVENVFNGYSRPYFLPNLWISGPIQDGRPECIEISYQAPKNIKKLGLIFNSTLETDTIYGVSQLIKKYCLEITDVSGLTRSIMVEDNYLRFARHEINESNVIKLKFIFLENYGSEYYEVFSIILN